MSCDIILELREIVSSFPRDGQPSVGWDLPQVMCFAAGKRVRMSFGSLVVFTDPRPLQQSRFLAMPRCDAAFVVGTKKVK